MGGIDRIGNLSLHARLTMHRQKPSLNATGPRERESADRSNYW